jgi:DNA polymerase I-like protein with 3'-5' exonuclease and polymerase domains
VNFGFIYGMGWRKFIGYAKTQYGVEFTEREAQRIRAGFFDTYSALPDWHRAMREYARQHEMVRSYSGRIRHLPTIGSSEEFIQQEAERQAINSPVQEFASSLGVMATGRMDEQIDDRYLAAVAFVHDAIYCYVPYEYLLWGARTLKWYMESNKIEEWFGIKMRVPIVADVGFGLNMGDTYEMKGMGFKGDYDFSQFAYDESDPEQVKAAGGLPSIIVPPQRTPPNNGKRTTPLYSYVD